MIKEFPKNIPFKLKQSPGVEELQKRIAELEDEVKELKQRNQREAEDVWPMYKEFNIKRYGDME